MALTRKFLEALSIPENAVQAIIDEHTATVGNIKSELTAATQERDKAKTDIDAIQKELDALKSEDWKTKYEAEQKAHNALKETINAEKTKKNKENALKAYFEGKNIKDGNLKIALRGTDLSKIELDDEGKIKDVTALDELVKGDFAPLVDSGDRPRVVDSGAHVGENNGDTYNASLRAAFGLK